MTEQELRRQLALWQEVEHRLVLSRGFFFKKKIKQELATDLGLCYVMDTVCRLKSKDVEEFLTLCVKLRSRLLVYKPKKVYHDGVYWFKVGRINPRLKIVRKLISDLNTELFAQVANDFFMKLR